MNYKETDARNERLSARMHGHGQVTRPIQQHEKFLENYKMIRQIGHHYDMSMAPQMNRAS